MIDGKRLRRLSGQSQASRGKKKTRNFETLLERTCVCVCVFMKVRAFIKCTFYAIRIGPLNTKGTISTIHRATYIYLYFPLCFLAILFYPLHILGRHQLRVVHVCVCVFKLHTTTQSGLVILFIIYYYTRIGPLDTIILSSIFYPLSI